MPKFTIDFTVVKSHTEGQIEVDAPTLKAAIKKVEGMDPDKLIEDTGGVEWTVEAWGAMNLEEDEDA